MRQAVWIKIHISVQTSIVRVCECLCLLFLQSQLIQDWSRHKQLSHLPEDCLHHLQVMCKNSTDTCAIHCSLVPKCFWLFWFSSFITCSSNLLFSRLPSGIHLFISSLMDCCAKTSTKQKRGVIQQSNRQAITYRLEDASSTSYSHIVFCKLIIFASRCCIFSCYSHLLCEWPE